MCGGRYIKYEQRSMTECVGGLVVSDTEKAVFPYTTNGLSMPVIIVRGVICAKCNEIPI